MRNYHVKHKYINPQIERERTRKVILRIIETTVVLVTVVALYGWMSSRDAEAHMSSQLGKYMTYGFVEDRETIFMCGKKAYEVNK